MRKINLRELLRLGDQQEIRPLHIILGNRNFDKLGEIDNFIDVNYHPSIQTSEFSFSVYETVNGKNCRLWDEIINRRLIWVKEYDEWFEIYVDIDDSQRVTKKTITATYLPQAELSNINIDGAEINTEVDIEREDYKSATFYNPNDTEASILHRVLKKVPNYTIDHVDESLWGLWRAFSISEGTNIYDFLVNTLQEEIGCLFLFESTTRTINVYDMQFACECGYRSESEIFECTKCKGTNIHQPYGNDTTIMVTKQNLGNNVQLSSNAGEVKNCFRVTGGDEYINAAIINASPNGTNVIYEFDEETRRDMSDELTARIDEYNTLIKEYRTEREFIIDENIVEQVNMIIQNVNNIYPDKFETVSDIYIGYSSLTKTSYDIKDLELYLDMAMMPTWEQEETTAIEQAKLIEDNLSVVSVKDVSVISDSTADNAVLLMVRAIIDTNRYKPELVNTTLSSQTWTGQIKLTNYSNEEDTATTVVLTVEINDDMESYLDQAVQKIASKIDDIGIKELFKIEDNTEFANELKKYCLLSLKSFENAYNTVLLALTEAKASEENSEFHKSFYEPYYDKLGLIQEEISIRDTEIGIVMTMQEQLNEIQENAKEVLNFEKYLGEDLWNIFISYRREDSYSNENYISDGLSNAELIEKATELIDISHKELIKSSTKQYTITASLTNLLLIKDEEGNPVFAPILDDFTLGNYIRCKINNVVYRMRILDITIDYNNLTTLSITFGDITKGKTLIDKMSDVIKQSNSVATSYSSIKRQANKGESAENSLAKMRKEGLDSAQYNIFNTNSTFILDEHGLLGRNYDDVTDQFSSEQIRINGSNIIMTDNAWKSTRLAIGKQIYTLDGVKNETYGVNADTVIGGKVIAGDIYSGNYLTKNGIIIKGTHFDLNNGNFELADGKLTYNSTTNKLNLKNVTLDWDSSNAPEVSINDVNGLDEQLNNINSTINGLDSEFTTAVTNINGSISDLQSQIDGNITTWFYDGVPTLSNAPANTWTTNDDKNKHLGDLYYDNQTGYAYRFQVLNGVYSWVRITDSDVTKALADAKNAQDTADAKRRVFVTTPTPPYDIGDLWVQGTNGDIMRCDTARTSGNYVATDWVKSSKYTDDTTANNALNKANAAKTTADSAKSVADNAKTIGDNLVNVLGYDGTKITGTYIYSPVISGGSILVGDKNGTYAEITPSGILNANGANITGDITATSGTIGNLTITDSGLSFENGINIETAIGNAQSTANTAVTKANNAQTSANNATKTATNFLYYDTTNGLQIGNKTTGSWNGTRTQITSNSFNILNSSGEAISKFGASSIDLGINSGSPLISISTTNKYGYDYPTISSTDSLRILSPSSIEIACSDLDETSDLTKVITSSVGCDYINNMTYLTLNKGDDNFCQHMLQNVDGINKIWSYSSTSYNNNENYVVAQNNLETYYDEFENAYWDVSLNSNKSDDNWSTRITCKGGNGDIYDSNEISMNILRNGNGAGIHMGFFATGRTNIQMSADSILFNQRQYGVNQILWSGALLMTNFETIYLSSTVSAQPHGIVFVFSAYENDTAGDWNWNAIFYPKYLSSTHTNQGHTFMLMDNSYCSIFATKWLFINDTSITGHINNNVSSTGIIKYDNDKFVLRYIIGV